LTYNTGMAKKRLDLVLVEMELVETRSLAQRLVMAGKVRINGEPAVKPSQFVQDGATVTLDSGPRFVSRGGEKLAAAMETFPVSVQGLVCADVGASTGGFTDCLLQNGAAKVYAVDVGHGILAWTLRNDPRVVVMEQTNARHVEKLDEPVSLVVMDVSFISLKILLPVIRQWFPSPSGRGVRGEGGGGEVFALIKPQFEAGRKEVSKGKGVIRDPEIHRRVLHEILEFAQEKSYSVRGLHRSPVLGPKGNVEFLVWLGLGIPLADGDEIEAMIDAIVPPAEIPDEE
jgi:23S rRNA (cytidine1920-2'-O)/16S rRNA (cytidine1409-2'-O)-methyltransferase